MRRRTTLATAGLAVAATTILMSAPVAGAATVLSRADATAFSGAVAGNGQDSGSVEATYDGDKETVTGQSEPALGLLGGQTFANLGVAAQRANAGDGFSRACAGIAGSGGSVVQVGDSDCLNPGAEATATLGNLRLSDLTLGQGADSPLAALNPALQALAPLTTAFDDAVAQAQQQFGDAGLVLEIGALEGICSSTPDSATGAANLAGAQLVLKFPTQAMRDDLTIVQLPVNPAPDTVVPTNTSALVDALTEAIVTNFESSFDAQLLPVGTGLAQVLDQISAGIRDNLQDQLQPIEDNLVKLTLNEQSRPTQDSIEVTALHLEVLPAAVQFVDAAAVDLRIGSVGCGPAGTRVVNEPTASPAPTPRPEVAPRVPTAVSAGVAGDGSDGGPGLAAYAALALGAGAAGAAGVSVVRRRSALRG